MYSPGAPKVAVGVALPVAGSTSGFALLKVRRPGPRNLLHVIETGDAGALRSGVTTPSSAAYSVSVTGAGNVVPSVATIPRGGPCMGEPPGSSRSTGGVFLFA